MRPQGDILYITRTAGHYGIYHPGGSFDLRHRWATSKSKNGFLWIIKHAHALISQIPTKARLCFDFVIPCMWLFDVHKIGVVYALHGKAIPGLLL